MKLWATGEPTRKDPPARPQPSRRLEAAEAACEAMLRFLHAGELGTLEDVRQRLFDWERIRHEETGR